VPERLVAEAAARGEPEALAVEAGAVAGEQAPHDLDRLAQSGERLRLLEPELVEPGALDEAEVGAPVRGAIERRDLAGDLDRVQRVRVQRRRPDADPLGCRRDLEQGRDRRGEEQVVKDRDDVEARLLGPPGELGV
jgi:hypothetical protein